MHTPLASMLLFVLAAFLGALGQLLYKTGADAAGSTVASYLLNWRLLGGVVCYIAVMVLFVAAFKKGGVKPRPSQCQPWGVLALPSERHTDWYPRDGGLRPPYDAPPYAVNTEDM